MHRVLYTIVKTIIKILNNITKAVDLFTREIIKIGKTMDQELGAQDTFLNSRGGTYAILRETILLMSLEILLEYLKKKNLKNK